ncbi:hypothetical protein [Enterococcus hirae]|uniref:hypothetical protein n=1 Tax=Enterococcus hirae TaxID=1354 RepID=UPI001094BACF|nr:hypothetical protein [Enterococcus hirae]MDL4889346.1 hypothetical protein [Enterococcus hirae]MDL4892012.1 hypothetical protein [Enterococcus hirae]MDL4898149.1 hypothetical protein [Enterococcus hirae]MDL4900726.1 hypothetical protein [Enterococcus hirae]MDL4903369.1 hypothetical protein [Enterococcus hirae]
MDAHDLIVARVYIDEEDFFDLELYENVVSLKFIEDLIHDEKMLVAITSSGEEIELDTFDIEWFRYFPNDSHLAKYVRKGNRNHCEWDEQGNLISEN